MDYNGYLRTPGKFKVEPYSFYTNEVYCLDLVFSELNKDSKKGKNF